MKMMPVKIKAKMRHAALNTNRYQEWTQKY